MLWRLELSLDYLDNGFRQLSGFWGWSDIPIYWKTENEEETGKKLNPKRHLYFNSVCENTNLKIYLPPAKKRQVPSH